MLTLEKIKKAQKILDEADKKRFIRLPHWVRYLLDRSYRINHKLILKALEERK